METEPPPHDIGKVSRVHTHISHLFYDLIDSQQMISLFNDIQGGDQDNDKNKEEAGPNMSMTMSVEYQRFGGVRTGRMVKVSISCLFFSYPS